MKQIMSIINLIMFALLTWNCHEEPSLAPEILNQKETLQKKTSLGSITPLFTLPHGNSPEGITVDWRGKIFVSNTKDDGETNEILKVNKSGSWNVYATLPGSGQARGLTTDIRGNVYVAFATQDPATNGIYKIRRNKIPKRINGSENMAASNSLTFDMKGNLFATDSDGGSIWKYSKNKKFIKWFEDPLLAGGIIPGGPPFPLPGANGITFFPPNKLYVANTAQNSISLIRVAKDGQAQDIALIKQDFLLLNVDGIAVDINENIYGVLPSSTLAAMGLPPLPPLVKLNPNTGDLIPIVLPENSNQFNTPTSITFGSIFGKDRKNVFIANAALQYGQPMEPWSLPGIVKVNVGSIGF